jgi:hypothetical protein
MVVMEAFCKIRIRLPLYLVHLVGDGLIGGDEEDRESSDRYFIECLSMCVADLSWGGVAAVHLGPLALTPINNGWTILTLSRIV